MRGWPLLLLLAAALAAARAAPPPPPPPVLDDPYEDTSEQGPWAAGGRREFTVASEDDAKRYLQKYGYLRCSPVSGSPLGRPKRSATMDLDPREEDSGTGGPGAWDREAMEDRAFLKCSSADVQRSIKRFQTSKGLKATGVLDRPTMELMRQRRCGNKDTPREDDGKETANTLLDVAGGGAAGKKGDDKLTKAAKVDTDGEADATMRRRRRRRGVDGDDGELAEVDGDMDSNEVGEMFLRRRQRRRTDIHSVNGVERNERRIRVRRQSYRQMIRQSGNSEGTHQTWGGLRPSLKGNGGSSTGESTSSSNVEGVVPLRQSPSTTDGVMRRHLQLLDSVREDEQVHLRLRRSTDREKVAHNQHRVDMYNAMRNNIVNMNITGKVRRPQKHTENAEEETEAQKEEQKGVKQQHRGPEDEIEIEEDDVAPGADKLRYSKSDDDIGFHPRRRNKDHIEVQDEEYKDAHQQKQSKRVGETDSTDKKVRMNIEETPDKQYRVRRDAAPATPTIDSAPPTFSSSDSPMLLLLNKDVVRWTITWPSDRIPADSQYSIFLLAFRMWSEIIPIKFQCEVTTNSQQQAESGGRKRKKRSINSDILIEFQTGPHACPFKFDGRGGELAHSLPLNTIGRMHFDDEDDFKNKPYNNDSVNLLKVVLHEIGHILGFMHKDYTRSIMYPIYQSPGDKDIELPYYDRTMAKQYYGACETTFDVVFDWLRKESCVGRNASTCPRKYDYFFNTFFFHDKLLWLYENRQVRPRRGDPLDLRFAVHGMPAALDAAVQYLTYSLITWQGETVVEYFIHTMFFKDDLVYFYDDTENRITSVLPIATAFPAKNGTNYTAIPDNLDAVYLDVRNDHLFFFKGNVVYEYDPYAAPEDAGCCESVNNFTTMFPTAGETPDTYQGDAVPPMTGDVDAVYFSYVSMTVYFIKGKFVWQNTLFSHTDPATGKFSYNAVDQNLLTFRGKVNQYWLDICTVDVDQHFCQMPKEEDDWDEGDGGEV